MTKKVTERKKERQESVSDFLKPNVLVLSRKESENKGDIPPSLMALFSNFLLSYFTSFAIESCIHETDFTLGPSQKYNF